MTQENKELLLIDLCARLPYGVMCSIKGYEEKYWDSNFERYITNSIDKPVRITGISIDKDCIELDSLGISEVYGSDDFGGLKPYLRPMSSITEEERRKLNRINNEGLDEWLNANNPIEKWSSTCRIDGESVDYMNSRHLDYRGLIEKGLALEAPEGMYEFK